MSSDHLSIGLTKYLELDRIRKVLGVFRPPKSVSVTPVITRVPGMAVTNPGCRDDSIAPHGGFNSSAGRVSSWSEFRIFSDSPIHQVLWILSAWWVQPVLCSTSKTEGLTFCTVQCT